MALRSKKISDHFKQAGVSKGDRVVLLCENKSEFVLSLFACMHIGAIFVPVQATVALSDIEYIAKKVGAEYAVCSKEGYIKRIQSISVIKHVFIAFVRNSNIRNFNIILIVL